MNQRTWPTRLGNDATHTIAALGEAGILRLIGPHLQLADAEIGPGDDAAVLSRRDARTVVTTDSMLCDLDWRDEWSSPFDIGVKLVAQNLADIAAMGATPTGIVTALAADPSTSADWLVELTRGMSDELRRTGTGSLGGDLSGAASGQAILTVTALGALEPGQEPFLRSAAQPGEVLIVSDDLGWSQAGLLSFLGKTPQPSAEDVALVERARAVHRAPRPRYAVSEAREAGVRCALDVSDGLSTDAARLAAASRVRIDLDAAALNAMSAPLVAWLGAQLALNCVLASGEEHALLATCHPDRMPATWRVVGRVSAPSEENPAGLWLAGAPVAAKGWEHFS